MKISKYNFYVTILFIFELTLCLLSNAFENNYEPFPIKTNEKNNNTSYNC